MSKAPRELIGWRMRGHGLAALLAVSCMFGTARIAGAESFPDPMRPAIDFDSASSGQAAAELNANAQPASAGLQSVRIGAQGPRAALIDGKWYAEGALVAGAKLVSIRETQVVLRDARGRQRVMKMFPEVVMRPPNKTAPVASDKASPAGRRE